MTKKKKIKGPRLSEKLKRNKLPYIIHGSPLNDPSPYPTHTHGLHKIGWPEFIFDPLAFGAEQNSARINAAYMYFKKPKNRKKLQAILDGKTVELTFKEMQPKAKGEEPYVYCFREVSPEFEAVKMAYGSDVKEIEPGMRFIQIWVKGDDYVLTDEYYRGGIIR